MEYALTEKGVALSPIVEDMRVYGERWLGGECVEAAEQALGGRLVVAS